MNNTDSEIASEIYATADALQRAYRSLPCGADAWEKCVTLRARAISAVWRGADEATLTGHLQALKAQLASMEVAS